MRNTTYYKNGTTIPFDVILRNSDFAFYRKSSEFRAPVAGLYFLSLTSDYIQDFGLIRNQTTVAKGWYGLPSLLQLEISDVIKLRLEWSYTLNSGEDVGSEHRFYGTLLKEYGDHYRYYIHIRPITLI